MVKTSTSTLRIHVVFKVIKWRCLPVIVYTFNGKSSSIDSCQASVCWVPTLRRPKQYFDKKNVLASVVIAIRVPHAVPLYFVMSLANLSYPISLSLDLISEGRRHTWQMPLYTKYKFWYSWREEYGDQLYRVSS